jgi:hypothetical protein
VFVASEAEQHGHSAGWQCHQRHSC